MSVSRYRHSEGAKVLLAALIDIKKNVVPNCQMDVSELWVKIEQQTIFFTQEICQDLP